MESWTDLAVACFAGFQPIDRGYVVADFPVEGAGLLVLDAAMTVGVELIEVDVAVAGTGRAIGLDGNADEAELEAAFPRGTCSHGKKLLVASPRDTSWEWKEAAAGKTLSPECGSPPGTALASGEAIFE